MKMLRQIDVVTDDGPRRSITRRAIMLLGGGVGVGFGSVMAMGPAVAEGPAALDLSALDGERLIADSVGEVRGVPSLVGCRLETVEGEIPAGCVVRVEWNADIYVQDAILVTDGSGTSIALSDTKEVGRSGSLIQLEFSIDEKLRAHSIYTLVAGSVNVGQQLVFSESSDELFHVSLENRDGLSVRHTAVSAGGESDSPENFWAAECGVLWEKREWADGERWIWEPRACAVSLSKVGVFDLDMFLTVALDHRYSSGGDEANAYTFEVPVDDIIAGEPRIVQIDVPDFFASGDLLEFLPPSVTVHGVTDVGVQLVTGAESASQVANAVDQDSLYALSVSED